MKRRLSFYTILMLAAMVSASSISAARSTLIIGKGRNASATFSSVSGDGCTRIDVTVFAVAGTEHSPSGPPGAPSFASVNVGTSSLCGAAPGLSASGFILNPDFEIDRKLDAATLNGTIAVSGDLAISSVDINLTWTGLGDSVTSHSREVSSGPDSTAVFNGHGTIRHGQASGTVSAGTLNYTPELSVSGNLTSGHFVELMFLR
jgi:hypothetical protein